MVHRLTSTWGFIRDGGGSGTIMKSGNGYKNPWDPPEKARETTVWMIYVKGKFWVWSGTEMEWCIVKVVVIMNRREMRWQWQGLIIDRLAKFFGDFIPETRWSMAEWAVVDFQRRIRRWTSKGDNIRGTNTVMGWTVEERRSCRYEGSVVGSKYFVSKRKYLIDYSFFNLEPV